LGPGGQEAQGKGLDRLGTINFHSIGAAPFDESGFLRTRGKEKRGDTLKKPILLMMAEEVPKKGRILQPSQEPPKGEQKLPDEGRAIARILRPGKEKKTKAARSTTSIHGVKPCLQRKDEKTNPFCGLRSDSL